MSVDKKPVNQTVNDLIKSAVHEVLFTKEGFTSEDDFKSSLKGVIVETIEAAGKALENNVKEVVKNNAHDLVCGIFGIEKDRWSGKLKYTVFRTNGFVGLLQNLVENRVKVILNSSDVELLIKETLLGVGLKLKKQPKLIAELRESYTRAFRDRLKDLISTTLVNLSPATKEDLHKDLSAEIGKILNDLVKSDEQMTKELEFVIKHVIAQNF